MSSRRDFIKQGSLIGLAGMSNPKALFSDTVKMQTPQNSAWADGSRLVVSVSMQFEAGGPHFQGEEEETDVFDQFIRSGQLPVR